MIERLGCNIDTTTVILGSNLEIVARLRLQVTVAVMRRRLVVKLGKRWQPIPHVVRSKQFPRARRTIADIYPRSEANLVVHPGTEMSRDTSRHSPTLKQQIVFEIEIDIGALVVTLVVEFVLTGNPYPLSLFKVSTQRGAVNTLVAQSSPKCRLAQLPVYITIEFEPIDIDTMKILTKRLVAYQLEMIIRTIPVHLGREM